MNLDIEIQVLHHSFDHEHLLVILFAKVSVIRTRNQEQLRDNRQNATEVSRTVCTAIHPFELFIANKRHRVAIGVHFFDRRSKYKIRPNRFREFRVGFQAFRVLVQVLVLAKLDGVQKHTNNRHIALAHGRFDQCTMTIMECPHRWNETDSFPFFR